MATRFYFQDSGAPSVSPAFDANWEQTGQADRISLLRSTTLTALTALANRTITVPITTTQDVLSRQYVSEPMPAQTISGKFELVIRCSESNNAANAHIAVSVRVCSQDGSTIRGTLYSSFANATEFTTTAQTRIFANITVTSQVAQAGDRLVLEIGAHLAAPASGQTAVHRYGTNATSDFPMASGLTSDLRPWCEFSQNIWAALPGNYQSFKSNILSVGERVR